MNKKVLGFVAVAAFLAVEMSAGTADAQGLMKRMRSRFGRSKQTQCCPTTNTCPTATCQTGSSSQGVAVAPVSYNEPVSYSEPISYDASASYAEPVSYSEPVSSAAYSEPMIESAPMIEGAVIESAPSSCGCASSDCACGGEMGIAQMNPVPLQQIVDTGSFQAVPAIGCEDCGSIQPASYVEPAGEYFGGDSGCIGCDTPVQGCVSGDCGGVSGEVFTDGGIVEGGIQGNVVGGGVIEGEIYGGEVIDGGVIEGAVIEGSAIEGEVVSPPSEPTSDVPAPPATAPAADDDQDA